MEQEVKDIQFEVIKNIYWDNWGRPALVFMKGDICKGKLYDDSTVTAESPYYEGVSDIVDTDCIRIIQ